MVGALEVLDAGEGVALGVASGNRAGVEVHRYRGIGATVRRGVLALTADEGVRTRAARELIATVAESLVEAVVEAAVEGVVASPP